MNDIVDDIINRAKMLQEFTVVTELPNEFRFNGLVPFDMSVSDGTITAKVFAVNFDEAVERLHNFLSTCV
jgi:hypothetical protein